MRMAFTDKSLRGILVESMSYEGTYKVAKDYIQPVIKQAALGLALLATWHQQQRVAILVGAVYFVLHLLSSFASRGGHRLVASTGSEEAAAKTLWGATALIYATLAWGLWTGWESIVIAGFVALAVLQNFWRPVLISRIDAHSTPEAGRDDIVGGSAEQICPRHGPRSPHRPLRGRLRASWEWASSPCCSRCPSPSRASAARERERFTIHR